MLDEFKKREPCGHHRVLDIWHDSSLPNQTGKEVRCHEEVWSEEDGEFRTGPLIDCPGYVEVLDEAAVQARITELEAALGSQAEATAALYFERDKLRGALAETYNTLHAWVGPGCKIEPGDEQRLAGVMRMLKDYIAREALEGEE